MTKKKTENKKAVKNKTRIITWEEIAAPFISLIDVSSYEGTEDTFHVCMELNDFWFLDGIKICKLSYDEGSCSDYHMAEYVIKQALKKKEFEYIFVKVSNSFDEFFGIKYDIIAVNDLKTFIKLVTPFTED